VEPPYAHFLEAAHLSVNWARATVASIEYSGSAGRRLYSIENLQTRVGHGNWLNLGSPATHANPAAQSSRVLNGQIHQQSIRRGNGGFLQTTTR